MLPTAHQQWCSTPSDCQQCHDRQDKPDQKYPVQSLQNLQYISKSLWPASGAMPPFLLRTLSRWILPARACNRRTCFMLPFVQVHVPVGASSCNNGVRLWVAQHAGDGMHDQKLQGAGIGISECSGARQGAGHTVKGTLGSSSGRVSTWRVVFRPYLGRSSLHLSLGSATLIVW